MDRNELNTEIEMASRLCEGADSKVVILCGGMHYEIENVIPLGVAIVLVAGPEAAAPLDPMLEDDSQALDEAMSEDIHTRESEAAHLRIAEDQPGQDRTVGKSPLFGAHYSDPRD